MKEEKLSQEQTFENFKKFLDLDMEIKRQMISLAPRETDDYNEETRLKYIDRLYSSIETLENKLKRIMEQFVPNSGIIIENKLKQIVEMLYGSKLEPGRINDLYRKTISNMDGKLVEEVKKKFVGYLNPDCNEILQKSNTLNEMLHICHSYVMNNEEILQQIPIVQKKENTRGQPIYLRGENTEFGAKILEAIPTDIDSYSTDLVAVDNRIFMMIRDLGHALTVELQKRDKENVMVSYFVPKICNEEMIKKLPGINKETINENGAYGGFYTVENDVCEEIANFLEKVPTDRDIPPIDYSKEFGKGLFKKSYESVTALKRKNIINKIKELIQRKIFKDNKER